MAAGALAALAVRLAALATHHRGVRGRSRHVVAAVLARRATVLTVAASRVLTVGHLIPIPAIFCCQPGI